MDGSQAVDFTAVDATAGQVAAWIRAADADGEWWAEEWPEGVCATAVGMDESAVGEPGGAGKPGGPRVEERSGTGSAEAEDAIEVERLMAGLEASRVADRRALTPIVQPCSISFAASDDAGSDGSADVGDPWRIDAEPGPVPANVAAWVRPEWWSAPIRDEVRALMLLAPGPVLITELARAGRAPTCVAYHGDPDRAVEAADPVPAPGSRPGYPCPCQLIVAAAWQAVASWSEVQAAEAVVDTAGAEPVIVDGPDGFARARAYDPARVELAAVLRLAPESVSGRLAHCRDLHAHPDLAAAAADGTFFPGSWKAVLYETANLPEAARSRVIGHVVDRARARQDADRRPWTPAETRRAVKTAVLTHAAGEAADARDKAQQRRRVSVTPDADGMAWISACIRDLDAHRIYHRLTAAGAAHKADHPDDDRDADQRRADLFVALLLGHHTNPASPDSPTDPDSPTGRDAGAGCAGQQADPKAAAGQGDSRPDGDGHPDQGDQLDPEVRTDAGGELRDGHESRAIDRVGEDARTGEDRPSGQGEDRADRSAGFGTGPVPLPARPDVHVVITLDTLLGLADTPAEVSGMGPIPADLARELAADGRWRLLVTDTASGGMVIGTSRHTYAPGAALARLIRARETYCRMPGCNRQAAGCDLDHTVPFPAAPGTAAENLGPICRGHHNLKTHHGYQLTNLPPPADSTDRPRKSVTAERVEPPDEAPPGVETHPRSGSGWRWTFPSGLTHTDQPEPPLPDDSWPIDDEHGEASNPPA